MKLDITEDRLIEKLKGNKLPVLIVEGEKCGNIEVAEYRAITAVSILRAAGVTFKQPIDWEAETHDPSEIPKNWLVEKWDEGRSHLRVLGFPYGDGAGPSYDNYRAIKKEDWPKWAIEAHESLEE